jgi:hypothetical protein
MGKRTLKRKKRKRTLRGGVSAEDIQNVLKEIKTQVYGEDEDEHGFYERLYNLLENDHLNNLADENDELSRDIAAIEGYLQQFEHTLRDVRELTVDQIPPLRDNLIRRLDNMVNYVNNIPNDAEEAIEISHSMLDEIRAEIRFIQEQFNRLI